jgi:DNA-binding CsgD family transcriptional regulator
MMIDFDDVQPNRPEDAGFQRIELGQHRDLRVREQLDRLRCGIVFCDVAARVHWLNGSAVRLLAAGALRLIGARLVADGEADMQTLLHQLAEAAAAADNTARYLCLGQGKRTLHVAVQVGVSSSSIALTLTSPSRPADISTDALIQLFGLTPTEACLLAALATGSSVGQYAQQRRVSVETARVQLKSCLKKTGVQRQSELVRLVWSSAVAYLSSGEG